MIPTQPTDETIALEALKRFYNGADPDAGELARAVAQGINTVKREIMTIGKTWRPLLKTVYSRISPNVSHYPNPSDFETNYTVGLMRGDARLLSEVESAQRFTLDSTELFGASAAGKALFMLSGPAAANAGFIKDYNPATRVCNLVEAFPATPLVLDRYMIVVRVTDLIFIEADRYDQYEYPGRVDEPRRYANIPGLPGHIALHPVPDKTYGLRRRYFADLMKLDTDDDFYGSVLCRWAGVIEQGVYCWKLGEDDDRYVTQQTIYQNMLVQLMTHDLVGFDAERAAKAMGAG